ncbi:hypothetical protein [Novipirellula artificiosorum]|uniref:Uncharacterized protein n=1 Tax=Novipirellula artificiosorum TaxID=2528016 RepID=A0A5C6D583_9BACT|nr:hypothetical protein [Novipirellula artificiosorum]TWU32010.1 hypothetical protein Poly41_58980 [Novipirellula artificiosorum]
MTSFAILVLGVIVSAITGTGAIMIGLQEAADPDHSRVEDLSAVEKQIVGRDGPG